MPKKKPQGIRKRGQNYFVNIKVAGLPRKEVMVGPDLDEAKKLRNRLKGMALDGSLKSILEPKNASVTFSEAIDEHWEAHLKRQKSGKNMLINLKNASRVFGTMEVAAVTWQGIEKYRNHRLGEASPAYVSKELSMMGAVFDRQVKLGRITQNPVKLVSKPIVRNTRERILSEEEFQTLLSIRWEVNNRGTKKLKTMEAHTRLALVIADYTAMRIGEILSVTWKDVNLEEGLITVRESKNGYSRLVPIHPELKKILSEEKERFGSVVSFKGTAAMTSISKGFMKARKEAGLEDMTIHDFRHRAITRWVQEGKPINIIMAASGHRTTSAFLRYSNLRQADVKILVGGKVKPLPVISFATFKKLQSQKVWQECGKSRFHKKH